MKEKRVHDTGEEYLNHGFHQSANDWITCKCGKLFSNSKKGRRSAKEKFEIHLIKEGLK